MDSLSSASYISLSDDDASTAERLTFSPSSSYIIPITSSCPLLDTPPPLIALIVDCMDDLTAIRYLSTCRSLHAGYHAYPLKQAVRESDFRAATQLQQYFDRRNSVSMYAFVLFLACIGLPVVVLTKRAYMERLTQLVFTGLFSAVVLGLSCYILWVVLLRPRRDCCVRGRWGMWRRHYLMPRVTRLTTAPRDARYLPYLQHLTELIIAYDKRKPFGKKYPLPASVRTLHLGSSPDLKLTADILPPRLTSLSLSAVNNTPLPAGVLPSSLTSLHLTHGFDTRFDIGQGVLPSGLQELMLDKWTLPLSNIVLPASLIELSVGWLSNHPLPTLPPQLQVLHIGGAFNQPLTGVLPPSLRILRLDGHFDKPLSADVFASTPALEELHLSDHSSHELAASALPRSLRMLRVGKLCSLVAAEASEVPPQLRRLVVAAGWSEERVTEFERLGARHGFTVEQEPT